MSTQNHDNHDDHNDWKFPLFLLFSVTVAIAITGLITTIIMTG